ncbi:hypothetical protein B0A50_08056 [Salinomyces thailandicus]|uniref:Uncharacterized protein n=1 Tax=Salinomyces thailandicus TaxID=706561 RepID=A0A4U0TLC2_9PEZI|nr:hypothetical protein B0A50_08056 [Salinomyces thailandica]
MTLFISLRDQDSVEALYSRGKGEGKKPKKVGKGEKETKTTVTMRPKKNTETDGDAGIAKGEKKKKVKKGKKSGKNSTEEEADTSVTQEKPLRKGRAEELRDESRKGARSRNTSLDRLYIRPTG